MKRQQTEDDLRAFAATEGPARPADQYTAAQLLALIDALEARVAALEDAAVQPGDTLDANGKTLIVSDEGSPIR